MLWLSFDEWSCYLVAQNWPCYKLKKKWAAETFSDYTACVQSLLRKHQNECSGLFTDHSEEV